MLALPTLLLASVEFPWVRLSGMTPADAPAVDTAFAAMMNPDTAAERMLAMIKNQRGLSIAQVDFVEHGLQMATRALRAGWSEEWVVGSLLHDVGESLIPNGHGEIAAAMLRPYVTTCSTRTTFASTPTALRAFAVLPHQLLVSATLAMRRTTAVVVAVVVPR